LKSDGYGLAFIKWKGLRSHRLPPIPKDLSRADCGDGLEQNGGPDAAAARARGAWPQARRRGMDRTQGPPLFAGPGDPDQSARPVLTCLGGDLGHVRDVVGAAAVLDMAVMIHQLTHYLGVDVLASLLPPGDLATHLAWRIHRAEFDNPDASLTVWNAAPSPLGHGSRDIATVIEVLQAGWALHGRPGLVLPAAAGQTILPPHDPCHCQHPCRHPARCHPFRPLGRRA